MSSLRADLQIAPQQLFTSSSTQGADLGALATTGDGRYFRYVLAGGSNLVAGKLQQSAAEDTTNWENLAVAAAAANALTVTTTTTVTLTANEVAGGWLMVTVTPGQGYQYQIASHPAVTTAVVTFTLSDPIQVALTTASKIDVIPSPFANVIVAPVAGSLTGTIVGVAVNATTTAQYGWLQTHGPVNVLADDAITVGTEVQASDTVGGAVTPANVSAGVYPNVGYAITGIADTEYGSVFLTID